MTNTTYIPDQTVGIIDKSAKLADLLKNDTTLGRENVVDLGKSSNDIAKIIEVRGGAIYRQFAPYDDQYVSDKDS
tara:strand:- start:681 stop:905 length:225 start_codon:yes stop_codon:yes gene_type:complete